MRYRWFHRPELHTALSGKEKRASWLELIYDLVFAASFIQLGRGLSQDFSLESLFSFSIVFSALWFSWTGFTFYSNRFNVDDFAHRVLVFAQMLAISAMTAFASRITLGDPKYFSLSYAVAQLIVAIMYARSWKQSTHGRGFSRYWGSIFFFGACTWALAAFTPQNVSLALWALGLLAFIGSPFSRHSRELARRAPYDLAHLANRYGLLTIIVLGEAFMQVMSGVMDAGQGPRVVLQVGFTLVIAVSLWWIYFDDIGGSQIKNSKFAFNFWLYGHIPLHGSIVALGVGLLHVVSRDLSDPVDGPTRWLLCSSLALAFASVALLDWATVRSQAEMSERVRRDARLASAALILLLAPAGRGMIGFLFVALLGVICGSQIILDMIMAPLDSESGTDEAVLTSELARRLSEGSAESMSIPPRARLTQAIRKGTPSEFRRDLYFFFIEGSWRGFLFSVLASYLMINVFFAGLYMIEPGSISNAGPDSFADAFFFSVQTFATIGYGNLHPATTYGNIIVIIEAAVSLAGVAMVTGLMFAKASKPRPGIVFSKNVVITRMNGKPYLMFRTGNTRGNEIVSAEIMVSVLRDETSPEGHHMRRMHDLKLTRHRSPFFALTWLVLHEIDEASPFFGVRTQNDLDVHINSLTCILTGHDSTYGQTVFARHIYAPEDIIVGAKFRDVISQMPDGRYVVDYTKFNDVEALLL